MPPSSITAYMWVWQASEAQLQDGNVRFCCTPAVRWSSGKGKLWSTGAEQESLISGVFRVQGMSSMEESETPLSNPLIYPVLYCPEICYTSTRHDA
jgi:hypothetical protein